MKQFLKKIKLKPHNKKLVEITSDVNLFLNESDIQEGLINLSILHTSASLFVQENGSKPELGHRHAVGCWRSI